MQHLLLFFYALGNSAKAMKTINMDIMQNIFLMKHFTQCTIFFLPQHLHEYSIHVSKQINIPPCRNPENGMWSNGKKKKLTLTLLMWIFVSLKTANKPQGEMKICAV